MGGRIVIATTKLTARDIARFWSYVEKTDGCWLWIGYKSNGYGRFYFGGDKAGVFAHRITYELAVGPIPQGLVIDHLCRVPACVNPAHLEPVTQAENVRRGLQGSLVTTCTNGHLYTADNTYFRPNGQRSCRECHRINNRRQNERRKALRRAAR